MTSKRCEQENPESKIIFFGGNKFEARTKQENNNTMLLPATCLFDIVNRVVDTHVGHHVEGNGAFKSVITMENKNLASSSVYFGAVVVAQLAEWSFPILEICGSNPAISAVHCLPLRR